MFGPLLKRRLPKAPWNPFTRWLILGFVFLFLSVVSVFSGLLQRGMQPAWLVHYSKVFGLYSILKIYG